MEQIFAKITELCQQNHTLEHISKELNLTHKETWDYLKQLNYPAKYKLWPKSSYNTGQRYPIDQTLFDKIDDQWKAYTLGIIFSDGCLTCNGIVIELSIKDKDILDYINQKIYNNSKPLKLIKGKLTKFYDNKLHQCADTIRFTLHNKHIVSKLIELGLHERKSLTIEYPKIDRLHADFVRGYFDGNGSVGIVKHNDSKTHYKSCFVSIYGSETILLPIQQILKDNNIDMPKYRAKGSKICFLNTKKYEVIKNFYDFIYGNNPEFYLRRKHDRFIEFFQYKEKMQKYLEISFAGVEFDSKEQKWSLIYNNEFVDYFNTSEEAMDRKLELISAI